MYIWDRFYMSATVGQWVQGALGRTYIETLREYDEVADFVEDFRLLMVELKHGALDEIFFVPETVLGIGYMVRNAQGKRFEIFWLGGDGEAEDEQGEHETVTEDKVLETLLERQMTENWFRVPVTAKEERWREETSDHSKLIVDFVASGEILGSDEEEELPQRITDEEEEQIAA